MDYCAAFNVSTGFEDIEYFRKETQIAATSVIAITVVVSQIWLLLLFLPLPQLPKCMRKLDIEVNFEEIFNKKNKISAESNELDQLIADEKELVKRRKRASGGVATLIIIVILIIVSTTSFVVTSESPGTVSYQTNRLSSIDSLINSVRTLGLIFNFDRAEGRVQNTYLNFIDPLQQPGRSSSTCQLTPVSPSPVGGVRFSLDAGRFSTQPSSYGLGIQTYATVCRIVSPRTKRAFTVGAHGPVSPPLATYPPPGTLVDTSVVVQSREVTTKTTVPVVRFTWTWTEMVSTSPLDLLAPVTSSRRMQAKATYDLSTRGINDSFAFVNSNGETKEYPWPTCDSFAGYEPALSFIISYQPDSPNNQSYVVSETSLVSWAFATLITLGSVIALKPTIANYLDKLSNYWRMKQWVQWVLFSLYTLLMPLPMLFVLLKFITYEERLEVRGANFSYYMYMVTLLIVMAALLMLTWVGVLIRHVYTSIKRSKQNEMRDVPVNIEAGKSEYEAM